MDGFNAAGTSIRSRKSGPPSDHPHGEPPKNGTSSDLSLLLVWRSAQAGQGTRHGNGARHSFNMPPCLESRFAHLRAVAPRRLFVLESGGHDNDERFGLRLRLR